MSVKVDPHDPSPLAARSRPRSPEEEEEDDASEVEMVRVREEEKKARAREKGRERQRRKREKDKRAREVGHHSVACHLAGADRMGIGQSDRYFPRPDFDHRYSPPDLHSRSLSDKPRRISPSSDVCPFLRFIKLLHSTPLVIPLLPIPNPIVRPVHDLRLRLTSILA